MTAPLDPARWDALSALLDTALDLDPEARAVWLAERRREQPEVTAQLERLLERETRADAEGFLEAAEHKPGADLLASPDAQLLGPWKLERPIGHGGMGTVWLARRRDGRFEGTAAIKFLTFAFGGAEAEARFRREGNVLARLAHPNIARLLDAGLTPSGQPYLVLEYVDGAPIDAWCDQRGLDVHARLALFQQVLAAIAHAHANLIVHRDVKPSNILVTADGTAKLLDFGIAKLLDPVSTNDTVTTGQPLTFDSAAPEQIRGDPVSTATDVYSLGVLLYQLLSGRHPTNEGCTTAPARVHAILEARPVPLSRAVTADRLRRLLARDLDEIVAKALEKDPAQRYGTVAAFSEDLTRYVHNVPIAARRASWTHRTAKFVRRNRTAVLAGTLAWLAVTGTAVVAVVQAHSARAQRDAALYQTERANAQVEFQTLLLSEVGDRPMTMGEILDRGRDLLLRQYGGDPRFLVPLLVDLSGRYFDLGDSRSRADVLRKADSIATQLGDASLLAQVRCQRVEGLRADGKYDEAWRMLSAVDSLFIGRADPLRRAGCLMARSDLASETGHPDEGVVAARAAVAIKQSLGQTRDATYYGMLDALAHALGESGHPREAIATWDRAIGGMDSSGRGGTLDRLVMQHNVARVLVKLGETAEAERMFHDVLIRAGAADRQGRIDWQPLIHYAETAMAQGHADSASKYFGMILRRADAETNPFWQGRGLFGLARAQLALGQLAQARASGARFAKIARAYPPLKKTDDLVPDTTILAGFISLAAGDTAAAQADLLAALRANGFYEGKLHTRLMPVVLLVGRTALDLGDPAVTLRYARAAEATATVDSLTATQSAWVGHAQLLEARALLATGDTAGARHTVTAATRALTAGAGADHPLTAEARALLASLKTP